MNDKRILAVGDIHGCIDELNQLLHQMDYDPSYDQLIFLGDYVDKGPNPRAVLEKVMDLVTYDGAIALGGNHELIFLNWLTNHDFKRSPYFHRKVGGKRTVSCFYPFDLDTLDDEALARKYIYKHFPDHIHFIKHLPDFYETPNYLFVHAGINPKAPHWRETSPHDFRWIRDEFHHFSNQTTKNIVFGHTATDKLHQQPSNFNAWIHENKIGIDGGCVYGGNLIGLSIVGDKTEFFYTDKINKKNEVN